jgi:hypothetical protein
VKAGFWKVVTVDKVVCEKQDLCTAQATVEYDRRGMRIRTPLQETWIQEGKNWWYATKE